MNQEDTQFFWMVICCESSARAIFCICFFGVQSILTGTGTPWTVDLNTNSRHSEVAPKRVHRSDLESSSSRLSTSQYSTDGMFTIDKVHCTPAVPVPVVAVSGFHYWSFPDGSTVHLTRTTATATATNFFTTEFCFVLRDYVQD
jgi:hypothetical protein